MFDSLIADFLPVCLFSICPPYQHIPTRRADKVKGWGGGGGGQTSYLGVFIGGFDVPARHVGLGRADLTDDAHRLGGVRVGAFISLSFIVSIQAYAYT